MVEQLRTRELKDEGDAGKERSRKNENLGGGG